MKIVIPISNCPHKNIKIKIIKLVTPKSKRHMRSDNHTPFSKQKAIMTCECYHMVLLQNYTLNVFNCIFYVLEIKSHSMIYVRR